MLLVCCRSSALASTFRGRGAQEHLYAHTARLTKNGTWLSSLPPLQHLKRAPFGDIGASQTKPGPPASVAKRHISTSSNRSWENDGTSGGKGNHEKSRQGLSKIVATTFSSVWGRTKQGKTSATMASSLGESAARARIRSPIPPPPATRKLGSSDGPLVWIDCEMTGLDLNNDRIIEIACIVTDGQLEKVDDGVNYVIKTDKKHLDEMNEWCVKQHGGSGLTAACLDTSVACEHADVRAALLAYVRDRVPTQRAACLAGNTVHADARFLHKEMPELINHLHYRIVDVSSIKELVARWYGANERWQRGHSSMHRALDDIEGSIEELRHYRKRIFPATLPPQGE